MSDQTIVAQILELKKTRQAVILAHNYVDGSIQDLADFVGDSLELSIKAKNVKAPMIVFCGVRFMAETAKILSPDSTVLLPVPDAGCPMADMADPIAVREYKKQHPDTLLVAYVNTTAAVKAEIDLCCTSANAKKIIASLPPEQKIMFLPDRNLGANVRNQLHVPMELWAGYCPLHNSVTPEMLQQARMQYPDAEILIHPECPPEVIALADFALSTGGMLRHIKESNKRQFWIGTEQGIIHRMRKENPDCEFFSPEPPILCHDMKKITLEDLRNALQNLVHEVKLDKDLMDRARRPIERMLELS